MLSTRPSRSVEGAVDSRPPCQCGIPSDRRTPRQAPTAAAADNEDTDVFRVYKSQKSHGPSPLLAASGRRGDSGTKQKKRPLEAPETRQGQEMRKKVSREGPEIVSSTTMTNRDHDGPAVSSEQQRPSETTSEESVATEASIRGDASTLTYWANREAVEVKFWDEAVEQLRIPIIQEPPPSLDRTGLAIFIQHGLLSNDVSTPILDQLGILV